MQYTIRCENDIKLTSQDAGQVINIGLVKLGRNSQFFAERPGQGDGILREINARDDGSATRPGQRIQAEVALQVQKGLPIYIP